jgi:hypothetical protein
MVREWRQRSPGWHPHNSWASVYTHSHQFDVALVLEHANIGKFHPETFSRRFLAAYNNK